MFLHKATIVCRENICRKGKFFMNNRRTNNSKIVKKQRIRKFREFQRSAVAIAAAASFALTLSSCEDVAESVSTTYQKTQNGTEQTQSAPADQTMASEELPFIPPDDIEEPDESLGAPSVTKPPATEPPVTEPPATEPPVTEPPVTEPPVTEPPVTEPPVVEPVIEVRQSIHFETIPYSTVYVKNDNMYDDESAVFVQGKNGSVQITVYTTYVDGVKTESRSERKVLSSAQNCVIHVGTKPSVTTEEKTVTETVEKYSTIYEECDTMDVGTTKVKTEGKDSVATRTYRYTYTRGTLTGTELISESISERVDMVVLVGTKKPVQDTSFGMPFIDAAHGGVDYSVTQYFSSSHTALDFGVYYGDAICAAMGGTVIAAYDEGYFSTDNILWTYGTYVVIQHDGYKTYYAHLSSRTVSVGDRVEKGQIIGYSGNTGRVNSSASGPYAGTHLHFEIRKYNASLGVYRTVDPKLYLPWWN